MTHSGHSVAEPQPKSSPALRTRHAPASYAWRVANPTKEHDLPKLEARIMAHVRAAMSDQGWGLTDMATELHEDKGALSHMLNGDRSPSVWVVRQFLARFPSVTAKA